MNIEHEFTQYLNKIGLDPLTANKIQLKETRKAFYAGIATMYTQFIAWADQGEEYDDDNSQTALDVARQLDEFIENQKADPTAN